MKFKQGDKVRVVSVDKSSKKFHKVGTILTIDSSYKSYGRTLYHFKEPEVSGNGLYEHELELAVLTTSDITAGMMVKYRDGRLAIVYNAAEGIVFVDTVGVYAEAAHYNDDLSYGNKAMSYIDIVAVYGVAEARYVNRYETVTRELLWEEVAEMTVAEIEKALGRKIRIIK